MTGGPRKRARSRFGIRATTGSVSVTTNRWWLLPVLVFFVGNKVTRWGKEGEKIFYLLVFCFVSNEFKIDFMAKKLFFKVIHSVYQLMTSL